MTASAHESAAQFLLAARHRGTPGPRIPEECRPPTIADALAVQSRIAQLVGQPIGGYKCSVPSEPRPVAFAPIFAPTIYRDSPCPAPGSGGSVRAEPEIAFVLARDLPARGKAYSDEEVRAAIKEARFVLEILGSRYADLASVSYPEHLADSLQNQALFVGPALAPPWDARLEAFPITVRTPDGVFTTRDGKHPDVHPLRGLYWLANYLAEHGAPLRAGTIVTTGSYCGVVDVPLDKALTFGFGDLGSLAVTFTRK